MSQNLSLSLSGSQISSMKRSGSSGAMSGKSGSARSNSGRPGSAGGNRPSSGRSSARSTTSTTRGKSPGRGEMGANFGGKVANGRGSGLTRSSSSSGIGSSESRQKRLAESTHRSNTTDDSDSLLQAMENPNSTDFMALFNNDHQPVIRSKASGTTKKSATQKKRQEPMSSRAFQIPISARTSSTLDSYRLNSSRSPAGDAAASPFESLTQHLEKDIDSNHIARNSYQQAEKDYGSMPLRNDGPAVSPRGPDKNLRPPSPVKTNENEFQLGEEPTRYWSTSQSAYTGVPLNRSAHDANARLLRTSTSSDHPVAEEYIESVNEAATKIQRWYRGCVQEKQKEGEDEIRKILSQKRKERSDMIHREQDSVRTREQQERDRKRSREDKLRQARQAAIQDLQRSREQKKQEIKEKAEEELRYLKASGKVGKKPTTKKVATKKQSTGSGPSPRKKPTDGTTARSTEPELSGQQRPATASSTGRKVDDIFESEPSTHRTGATENGYIGDTDSEQPNDAPSQAPTKTTLTDLLDTLKLLEEPVRVPSPTEKKQKGPAWLDIFDDKGEEEGEEEEDETKPTSSRYLSASMTGGKTGGPGGKGQTQYLSEENLQEATRRSLGGGEATKPVQKPKTMPSPSHALLTDEKLRNIMSFLDEVDQAEQETVSEFSQALDVDQAPTTSRTVPAVPLVPSAEEIQKLEEASAAASEVTNTVLSQRLQLEEKDRSVKMLQKALNQQRELTVRHAKEQDKETKRRLQLQKEEYEATIKRHLSFIDQLIDDKKALGEKYDGVVTELKQVDKKYQGRIKNMEDSHSRELSKIKDVQAAAEKLRREKWIDEKTKKIKEITVKGLEPEIQRLIANHKTEIKKLKTIHEAEMLQAEERAGQKYVRHIEELRDQLADEKEAACARERELAKQRYEKQLEQEEAAYQQQRRRMYSEVQEEKDRINEQARRQRQEMDRLQQTMEANSHKAISAMKEEYEKARDEQERRHRAEVKDLEERLRIEKEAWEENYMKKQETWLLSKERELKEQVRRDRDKEIEMVITRLEDDAQSSRDEQERAAENRIKRIRDKYEGELREVETSERKTQERLNEVKAHLAEVEGENLRIEALFKQKDHEVNEVNKVCERLNKERKNVEEVIRQEFADRLVAVEDENKRVKNEISEMRARHKLELTRIQESKEEEMEEVHKRVKQAIAKKEDVVSQLRQQHAAAVKRADHLESLLEQQRKQLVKKK
ncbi:centrosomal protein of 131 kDa-like isoform X2 [Lytechinus variegatus]|uniref:centrosomal protein of 131 kDa-like isoform X2 n=1 Tax=Lytechinus variegatus TaxID=7654 RepID=UPI001BB25FA8|nr:centrosomal protein of 131 kDa-like isoform X2 [Lytechinus variegatus]